MGTFIEKMDLLEKRSFHLLPLSRFSKHLEWKVEWKEYSNSDLSWSNDSSMIAFSAQIGASFGIWITDSGGKYFKFIKQGGVNPRWSPKEPKLIFLSKEEEDNFAIWMIIFKIK
jgi:Tol biopolymer transport system component